MKKTIPFFLVFCLLFLTACNASENLTLDLSDHTLENAKTEEEGYIFPGLSWSSTTDEVVALFDLPEATLSKTEVSYGADRNGDGKIHLTQSQMPAKLFGYSGTLTLLFLEDVLYQVSYDLETDAVDKVMDAFSVPLTTAFGKAGLIQYSIDDTPYSYVWSSPGGGYENTQLYLWRDVRRSERTVTLTWARTYN